MLPSFLIVGGHRCGTTWLHYNLSTHPEVFMPRKTKEVHFFDKNYQKGIAWYEQYFRDAVRMTAGECTPNYLYVPEASQRIRSHIPHAKIIVCLRHPVERCFSFYLLLRANWNCQASFEEQIERQPEIVREGYYLEYVQQYTRAFSRENVLCLLFDDIVSEPLQVLRRVARFIGVDDGFRFPLAATRINSASSIKYLSRSRLLCNVGRALKKYRFYRTAFAVDHFNRKQLPDMAPATRQRLLDTYREKNRQLAAFLGADLSAWER